MPDHTAATPCIEIRGLYKTYGAVHALEGADLTVRTGEMFGFLGPNGAGKTTTLRILMGLLRATAGRATVFGLDAWRDSTAIRASVGYLPGDVRFHEWMRGTAFLAFCDRVRGGGHAAEIERLRTRFELDARRRIRDYSAGMKQKLGLIQALMHRPRLLILDEPTTALDPLVRQTVYDELRAAVQRGQTVLFSSHTLSEVQLLCDRVAIIRRGRIIEDSTIADLQRRAMETQSIRRVEFTLRNHAGAAPAPPPNLDAAPIGDGRWVGHWRGPIDGLLPWLAQQDVTDVAIGAPSLEELFHDFYRDTPTAAQETAA